MYRATHVVIRFYKAMVYGSLSKFAGGRVKAQCSVANFFIPTETKIYYKLLLPPQVNMDMAESHKMLNHIRSQRLIPLFA